MIAIKKCLSELFGYSVRGESAGAKRHVNPDGSLGGFVSNKAIVHPGAYIAPTAYVYGGANIGPEDRLEAGDLATKNGISRNNMQGAPRFDEV